MLSTARIRSGEQWMPTCGCSWYVHLGLGDGEGKAEQILSTTWSGGWKGRTTCRLPKPSQQLVVDKALKPVARTTINDYTSIIITDQTAQACHPHHHQGFDLYNNVEP